jgi:mannose-1-phosphate guanylyltransferase
MDEATTPMDQNSVKEFPGFFGGRGTSNRTAVILAGGEGSRLRSLTRAIAGDDRPKQFCPILNSRTLLDVTRERVGLSVRPEHTYFCLTAKHSKYFNRLLWNVRDDQKIIQPENKGTAPAILYSLMQLASHSPDRTVALFPSDHYFSDDESFMKNVDLAFKAAELNKDAIILLGIEPERPEPSYGWIEPADSLFSGLAGSISRVQRFWEKPATGVAKQLMKKGCLWNSFVMVGKVSAFLDIFKEHLPSMFRMFAAAAKKFGTADEGPVIRSIYSWIEETNFSSEVLERSVDRLMVMRISDVKWNDLGEPQRVLGTLSALGVNAELMQALAA